MTERNQLVREVARKLGKGEPLEAVLRELRSHAHSMGDSILILASAQNIALECAQELVVRSETWRDYRDAYDSVESAFWGFLEDRGQKQKDGSIHIDASDL